MHFPSAASPGLSIPAEFAARVVVRGIHGKVTPGLHAAALAKGMRLLRHHGRLIRLRIDLEHRSVKDDATRFAATGRIEISGPVLVAHVASDNMGKSLDRLVEKLDRMLRERSRHRADRRNDRPAGTEFRDRMALPAESFSRRSSRD